MISQKSPVATRIRIATLPLCILLLGFAGSAVHGIVMRHDVPGAAYLAKPTEFPGLVLMNRPGALGTLISPTWVLTAAHVAHVLQPGHSVTVADRGFSIRRVVLHPGWRTPQTNIVDDIALLELDSAVPHVRPVPIYRGRSEISRVMLFAGRGGTGNGRDGLSRFEGPYDRLRRATNRVELVDERWLMFVFDSPATATELEGISGPGDSGGPAYLEADDKRFIAGVSSWQDSRLQGQQGVYGVKEYYARVSSYADWIDWVTKGSPEHQAE